MSENCRATTVSMWARRLAATLAIAVAAAATGVMPASATVDPNEPAPVTVTEPISSVNGVPTVSGETAVGKTLTVDAGNWSPETTLEYQWLADDLPLDAATGPALVLRPETAGKLIRIQVTGSQPGSSPETRLSEPTAPIELGTLSAATPDVSGQAVVGQTLTVEAGEWTPDTTFSYQWFADGTPLEGATEPTLVLGDLHAGKAIAVQITGSQPGYTAEARTSEPSASVLQVAVPVGVTFSDT